MLCKQILKEKGGWEPLTGARYGSRVEPWRHEQKTTAKRKERGGGLAIVGLGTVRELNPRKSALLACLHASRSPAPVVKLATLPQPSLTEY
eukprot:3020635-Karenia_brevis.AAC.1